MASQSSEPRAPIPHRPPILSIARAAVAASLLGGLFSGSAAAQPHASPAELTFEQVVRATRATSIAVRSAALDVRRSSAALAEAAAPFDSALDVRAAANRATQFGLVGAPVSASTYEQVTGTAGWSRRFRNGVVLTPEVSAAGTRAFENPLIDVTQVSAHVKLAAPLVRDQGGVITAAPERAAAVERDATVLGAEHVEAQTLLQAADGYWTYLAADRRLEVLTASEQRSQRDVTVTTALVKGEERTGSDLIQAQGYFSSRRAARIAAEGQRFEAARQLVTLLGADWDLVVRLPRPVTEFPTPRPGEYPDSTRRWIAQALRQRPDLASANLLVRGAEVRLGAARDELRQRLDVELSAGYTGQSSGLGTLVDLQPRLPGLEVGVSVSYQLPLEQTGARGKVARTLSAVEQEQLLEADLERRIPIGVLSAFESLKNSQLGLRESLDAVRLLEQTVENEKRKFQLGSATLFSVHQAEESLTDALLNKIDRQRDFAVSLANLQFETGALLGPPAVAAGVDRSAEIASRLTSFPD